ncbi:MAG: HAD family hydrolase [Oscillospiraceae bacterium]|nr:HAD family hydrolase [Oscillospiraceae bacterium]
MAITTVLFDLDGTLLPMDQDIFTKTYFSLLAKRLAAHGYEPEALIAGIWAGTKAMVKNNGSATNEEVFWADFCTRFGEKARNDMPHFEAFYREDFHQAQVSCGFEPQAAPIVALCKTLGLQTVLATSPIFPAIATEQRIAWAGLKPEDFALYTTYENAKHSKPNLDYYRDILSKLGLSPEECLMVGNDVDEDMIAEELGMQVFLLTPCMINRSGKDISVYPQGDFSALAEYLRALNK